MRQINVNVFVVDMAPKNASPARNAFLIVELLKLYKREKPALVFHYTIKPNIFGSVAARLAGIKSISVITGLGYAFLSETLVAKVARALYRVALSLPAQVWFLNQDDRDLFVKKRICSPAVARILPGEGINLTHFVPERSEQPSTVLLIARALWEKGIGEFVECARRMRKLNPDLKFALLGPSGADSPGGIPDTQIESWVREGAIEHLGVTDDVRPYIREALFVVLPSYREGIPRSLLEAAAMEKPVIATRVTGCKDVVIDGVTGFLCEPRSADDLHAALTKALALDDASRDEMGKAARTFVQKAFSNEKVFTQYHEVISELAAVR